ncbi:MAG TPA: sugar phosphate isomerase/epimerase family protein [Terriglobia bacterium]|nr:sugar phosphate isomerase/epimerase family protein [Terriglobia bacterium]
MRIPRRTFLKTAGAAAVAGPVLIDPARRIRAADTLTANRAAIDPASCAADALAADSGAPAASAEPRLLAGCCAYSYRKYLEHGPMTMEDFIRKGVELGLNGVDLTVYYLKSTDPAYLTSLRHLAFKNGMPFSGTGCGASMVQADKAKRAEVLEQIKHWVDATDRLGASHLRIFAGRLPAGATVDQGVAWSVEVMKPASDYAGARGITLGLEDHEGITERAETALEILHRVDSPYAGINLDISNFNAKSTEEQYAQIKACVPYATHSHVRDRFSNSQEPIDLDRVWRLFAEGGYKGYMSAEYEGEEDASTGVPKLIARMKSLCRKYSSV